MSKHPIMKGSISDRIRKTALVLFACLLAPVCCPSQTVPANRPDYNSALPNPSLYRDPFFDRFNGTPAMYFRMLSGGGYGIQESVVQFIRLRNGKAIAIPLLIFDEGKYRSETLSLMRSHGRKNVEAKGGSRNNDTQVVFSLPFRFSYRLRYRRGLLASINSRFDHTYRYKSKIETRLLHFTETQDEDAEHPTEYWINDRDQLVRFQADDGTLTEVSYREDGWYQRVIVQLPGTQPDTFYGAYRRFVPDPSDPETERYHFFLRNPFFADSVLHGEKSFTHELWTLSNHSGYVLAQHHTAQLRTGIRIAYDNSGYGEHSFYFAHLYMEKADGMVIADKIVDEYGGDTWIRGALYCDNRLFDRFCIIRRSSGQGTDSVSADWYETYRSEADGSCRDQAIRDLYHAPYCHGAGLDSLLFKQGLSRYTFQKEGRSRHLRFKDQQLERPATYDHVCDIELIIR